MNPNKIATLDPETIPTLDPETIPERDIFASIDNLEMKVDKLQATLDEILGQVSSGVEQVGPMLAALQSSPILKVLGVR